MRQAFMKGIVAGFLMFLSWTFPGTAAELPGTIDLGILPQAGVLAVNGVSYHGQAGVTLATGDIDGDGIMDMVIGAQTANSSGRSNSGEAFVVFGSKDLENKYSLDLAGDPGRVLHIYGEASGSQLGNAVAAGDVNGDGYGDILVGAYTASPEGRSDAGAVYILFGSPDLSSAEEVNLGSTSRTVVKILGETINDEFGISTAAGDLNGDGYSDVIIGAWGSSGGAGKTYVLFGKPELHLQNVIDMRTPPSGTLVITGSAPGDRSGFYTTTGDLNGDHFADLAIGSIYMDSGGRPDAGEVEVIFGSPNLAAKGQINLNEDQPGMIRLRGDQPGDYTGVKLSVGDLDMDGYNDLCICAFGADTPGGANAGKAYVVFGSSLLAEDTEIELGTHGNKVLCIMGEGAENWLGPSVFGDFNADGYTDLIVGANGFGSGMSGKAYVIYGSGSNSVRELGEMDLRYITSGVRQILGADSNGRVGYVFAAGDINDDEVDEIILGDHGATIGDIYMAGKVFVIRDGAATVQQNHFTYTHNTGNNATILIPSGITPCVGGTPIASGDEIGIFTSGGLCSGAGVWDGKNLAITVWGDNSNTTVRDGLSAGEAYTFRIWDASTKRTLRAVARYSQGTGVYQTDGISILSALETQPAEQNIPLVAGWNMVSSGMIPDDSSLESLLSGTGDTLVLLKNGKGEIYWPSYSIAQVREWSVTDGYQVYMNAPGELRISGREAFSGDIRYSLSKDWSLISFVGAEGMTPAEAFAPLGSRLVLVKDDKGNVFWPEYDVNTLESLHQGKAYWICLNSPGAFTYPPQTVFAKIAKASSAVNTRFQPVAVTGNNAVLLLRSGTGVTVNSEPLATGDEIGIFSPGGLCVGAGRWEEGKNLAITIWGDDEMTTVRDGIQGGEAYSIRVWSTKEGKEYTATATCNQGETRYTANGLTIIGTLFAGSSTDVAEEAPFRFSLSPNTPNPFNPSTTISFTLPESGPASLTVYDATGRKVAELAGGTFAAGSHRMEWNGSKFATGVYFYTLKAGGHTETRKMLLMK